MPDYSIRVLDRTISILKALMHSEMTLQEISAETDVHKSTVFRILNTLEKEFWVQQDPKTGYYRLSFGLFELGSSVANSLDFYKLSIPHLERLVSTTKFTTHLVTCDNGKVLYLNKLESSNELITQPSKVGYKVLMHCTAVGKVMLAYFDRVEIEKVIEKHGLPRFTPNTFTEKEALLKELEVIRGQGCAIDNQEIQEGLRCIAAPLFAFHGKVMGAISISGLIGDITEQTIPVLKEHVIQAAKNISRDLGYQG